MYETLGSLYGLVVFGGYCILFNLNNEASASNVMMRLGQKYSTNQLIEFDTHVFYQHYIATQEQLLFSS